MKNYGLTNWQIKKAHEKILKNKEFLQKNGVHIDNKFVPYADFVKNSYTNSDRYIAELQHRAWSIFDYAKEKELKNVFITLTLPSKWHKMKTYKGKLVYNPKFAGRKYICIINKIKFINAHVKQHIPFIEPIFDFSQTIDKYLPRNASKELSKMLKRFFDDRSYKNINKNERCYFRVTEPHKDGTPHLHISLFVPRANVEKIVKALERLYPSPLGKIETDIQSPVSYLMKYILKTLDDLREDDTKITNLSLWYLYHGIARFYTSRTFVALDVYRKLNGKYTLIELTKEYLSQALSIYLDTTTKKVILIENEFGTLYTPKPVNWQQKIDFNDRLGEDGTIQIDSGFDSVYKEKIVVPIPLIIDNKEFVYYDGNVKNIKKMPYQMNDFELYNYFNNLDIDSVDDKHYLYTRNLLIDRGYDVGELLKLTAIDDLEFELEFELEG